MKELDRMAGETGYDTRIEIGHRARQSLAGLLNQRLADMIDLFNQTKHAHWNVKGHEFIPAS